MTMGKLKIGFIGVGSMGQCAHLKNFAMLPECEVAALAEIRPELGRKVAARYGVPRVYNSHEELLEREKLDGLVAVQLFTRHSELMPQLLKAGIPILTEKPLAASIQQGEKIISALDTSGTWMMLGYHKRSDPATMFAKAEIERLKQSGELGRLQYVRILMPAGDWIASGFNDLVTTDEPFPALAEGTPPGDMDAQRYADYLAFVNYYIHQVNLMRHLLGEPYQVTFADPGGIMLAVRSNSGVTGVIEMSPYQTTVDWQESALAAFEHGYVKLELPAPLTANRAGRVEILRDPGHGVTPQVCSPHLPWVHAMRQQAVNFLRALHGEIPPMCEAHEGLEDLRIARDYLRLLKD
jgi:predicted dehydrogenase